MGIVIRQGVKGTIATYLGVAIGFVNTLWLYPKILTPDEIGLFRTLIDGAYILSIRNLAGVVPYVRAMDRVM